MEFKYKILTESFDAMVELRELIDSPTISFDVESTGLSFTDDRLVGISFATRDMSWYIQGDKALDSLSVILPRLFNDEKKWVIGHNIKFDMHFVREYFGMEITGRILDSMVAVFMVDENRPLALKKVSVDLLGLDEDLPSFKDMLRMAKEANNDTYDLAIADFQSQYPAYGTPLFPYTADVVCPTLKEDVTIFDIPIEKLGRYGALDARLTYDCMAKLSGMLQEQEVYNIYLKFMMELLRVLYEMERIGMYVDVPYLTIINEAYKAKTEGLEKDWIAKSNANRTPENVAISDVNPNSSKQLEQYLFEEKGVKTNGLSYKKTYDQETRRWVKGDYPSTDFVNLCRIAIRSDEHTDVETLLEYRKIQKAYSTYTSAMLDKQRGNRLHGDFNLVGTVTGRLSSNDPNLQNIPSHGEGGKDIKSAFSAPEGYSIICCLPEGSKIRTLSGLVNIEDSLGESAIQEDGSSSLITRVIDNGNQPVYELELVSGNTIEVTASHKIRVVDSFGDYIWRRADELLPSDYIAIQPTDLLDNNGYYRLPDTIYSHGNSKSITLPEYLDEEFSFYLGYCAGDGFSGENSRRDHGYVVNANDSSLFDRLLTYSQDVLGFEGSVRKYKGVFEFKTTSTPLYSVLDKIGWSKITVPDALYQSRSSVVCSYLSGLFEADGSVCDRISFATISEEFVKEIQNLLLSVGIFSTIRKQVHNKSGVGYIWTLQITSQYEEIFRDKIGFSSTRKMDKLDSLITSKRTRAIKYGGYPNLQHAFSDVHGELYKITNNVRNRGGRITPYTASKIKVLDELLYKNNDLYRVAEYGTVFVQLKNIKLCGVKHVYDITVPTTSSYICNGFINHNCDYSQLELRILAHFSKSPIFMDIFLNNKDPHQITADLLGIERRFAKNINFGWAYGATHFAICNTIEKAVYQSMSLKDIRDKEIVPRPNKNDAIKWLHDFDISYPYLVQFKVDSVKRATVRGYVTTIAGRRRHVPEVLNSYASPLEILKTSIGRQIPNSIIQGCKEGWTRVATTSGNIRIDRLNSDVHELFTYSGTTKNYTVHNTGEKETFRIRTNRGTDFVTKDHRFFIYRDGDLDVRKLSELSVGDIIVSKRSSSHARAPMYSSNACYLFGVLLGDGYYSHSKTHTNAVTIALDRHEDDSYKNAIKDSILSIDRGLNIREYYKKTSNTMTYTVEGESFRGFLFDAGFDFVTRDEKRIPEWVFQSTECERSSILRGMYDSDGGIVCDRYIGYTSKNKHLAYGFSYLCNSLGMLADIYESGDVFRVYIKDTESINTFMNVVGSNIERKTNIKTCSFKNDSIPTDIKKEVGNLISALPWSDRVHKFDEVQQSLIPQLKRGQNGSRNTIGKLLMTAKEVGADTEKLEKYLALDYATILSITPNGVNQTYDIEIFSEDHTYISGGLLQHNSAADIMGYAMVKLNPQLKKYKARLTGQVHDEIIVETPDECAEEVMNLVQSTMVSMGDFFHLRVPLIADPSVKANWYLAK